MTRSTDLDSLRNSLHLVRSFFFCSFFLMIPPPPSSTLFPYTTLFRSSPLTRAPGSRAARRAGPAIPTDDAPNTTSRDRKSTRLNSSHRCISYAVFCLKKKTSVVLIVDNMEVYRDWHGKRASTRQVLGR